MRTSIQQTAETRARILDLAGRLFRERGFDGIGVADLMKGAGLTHGAFYNHFESKDALAGEAIEGALKQTTCAWSAIAEADRGGGGFDSFMATYLSREHRDTPGSGCLVAALGVDVARQDSPVRHAFTSGLRPLIDFLTRHMSARSRVAKRQRALVTLATLVGTIVIARAVDDEALSDEVLEAARAAFSLGGDT